MGRMQSDSEKSLSSLAGAMDRWRAAAARLNQLSRLQMEALLIGNTQEFGKILWQKQTAQRDFRREAKQVSTLRQQTVVTELETERARQVRSLVSRMRQAESDIAGLLQEAARYELRSEEIIRLRMKNVRAA